MTFLCAAKSPCEKLSLATFIPASIKLWSIDLDDVAGPIVQTTFVFVFAGRNVLTVSRSLLLSSNEYIERAIDSD